MPSKTFLVKSNNDSWNFPGSPTLSKSTAALRSRSRRVTAQHACAAGATEPLPHPNVASNSERSHCVPGLPDEPRRLGLRRENNPASPRTLYPRLECRRSPRTKAPPRPARGWQQPPALGARTTAPETSREAPPTRAPPPSRQPPAPSAPGAPKGSSPASPRPHCFSS